MLRAPIRVDHRFRSLDVSSKLGWVSARVGGACAQGVDSVVIGMPLVMLLEAAQLAALRSFTRSLSDGRREG